jgi:hypothetical protein
MECGWRENSGRGPAYSGSLFQSGHHPEVEELARDVGQDLVNSARTSKGPRWPLWGGWRTVVRARLRRLERSGSRHVEHFGGVVGGRW